MIFLFLTARPASSRFTTTSTPEHPVARRLRESPVPEDAYPASLRCLRASVLGRTRGTEMRDIREPTTAARTDRKRGSAKMVHSAPSMSTFRKSTPSINLKMSTAGNSSTSRRT